MYCVRAWKFLSTWIWKRERTAECAPNGEEDAVERFQKPHQSQRKYQRVRGYVVSPCRRACS
jgi:hypothetical protein